MKVVPLTALKPGETARVFAVQGAWGAARHLAELGLVPGQLVRVLSAGWGPVLIEVRGSRIALGRGLAAKVLVRRSS